MEDAGIEPSSCDFGIDCQTKTRLDLIHNFLLLCWEKPVFYVFLQDAPACAGLAGERDSNPRYTQLLETLPVRQLQFAAALP
jgi:hypothetical protein